MNVDERKESIKQNKRKATIFFWIVCSVLIAAIAVTIVTIGVMGYLAPSYTHATWTNSAYDKNAYLFAALIGIMVIVLTVAIAIEVHSRLTGNQGGLEASQDLATKAVESINNKMIDINNSDNNE